MKRGLVIVLTGNGKGKTSSALGMALRASGHGMKTSIIQFIKKGTDIGEAEGIKKLSPYVELISGGRGFVGHNSDETRQKPHIEAAENTLKVAIEKITSGIYDIVVLDEINNAVDKKLIRIEDLIKLIKEKPPELHLIITGRNVDPAVIRYADMVTEMLNIKHPYNNGIPAQKGIDY